LKGWLTTYVKSCHNSEKEFDPQRRQYQYVNIERVVHANHKTGPHEFYLDVFPSQFISLDDFMNNSLKQNIHNQINIWLILKSHFPPMCMLKDRSWSGIIFFASFFIFFLLLLPCTVHLVYSFCFNQQCTIQIYFLFWQNLYYNHSDMFRYICITLREFQSCTLLQLRSLYMNKISFHLSN